MTQSQNDSVWLKPCRTFHFPGPRAGSALTQQWSPLSNFFFYHLFCNTLTFHLVCATEVVNGLAPLPLLEVWKGLVIGFCKGWNFLEFSQGLLFSSNPDSRPLFSLQKEEDTGETAPKVMMPLHLDIWEPTIFHTFKIRWATFSVPCWFIYLALFVLSLFLIALASHQMEPGWAECQCYTETEAGHLKFICFT